MRAPRPPDCLNGLRLNETHFKPFFDVKTKFADRASNIRSTLWQLVSMETQSLARFIYFRPIIFLTYFYYYFFLHS